MHSISIEQIRQYRLRAHHLDKAYPRSDLERVAGACGFQNSPPGAFEIALHNRVPDLSAEDMRRALEEERRLLQAWSFRGAPVVFPASQADAFLWALRALNGEPWIYTRGIQLALDALSMSFDEVLSLLIQVMPRLDDVVIKSKTALDQQLADWVLPLLPESKREPWTRPSMYGNPDKQTVGGAVVSFLLRPCSFMGLIVFAKREGISPSFTSFKNWTGHVLSSGDDAARRLARKYLHCYAPASLGGLMDWLGCSTAQAQRIWASVLDEIAPVIVDGKKRYVLSEDHAMLLSPPIAKRRLLLLGGHDPYLSPQDREFLLDDKKRQREVWQTVSNPGVILLDGGIVGIWRATKRGSELEINISLWNDFEHAKNALAGLCEEYASFRRLKLRSIAWT